MPAPKKGKRFGKSAAHQRLMLANLAAHLIEAEAITTTETKAKALRPYVEKLVTKAKVGGVHKQRQVVATIHDKDVTHKLFVDIGPRYTDRNGGYTRILKLGPRPGDNAPWRSDRAHRVRLIRTKIACTRRGVRACVVAASSAATVAVMLVVPPRASVAPGWHADSVSSEISDGRHTARLAALDES